MQPRADIGIEPVLFPCILLLGAALNFFEKRVSCIAADIGTVFMDKGVQLVADLVAKRIIGDDQVCG